MKPDWASSTLLISRLNTTEVMSNQERMQRHTEGRLGKITKIPATDSYPEKKGRRMPPSKNYPAPCEIHNTH